MTTNAVLSTFDLPTITEIYNLIVTAKKSSPNDPLPLPITKLIASTLAPLLKIIIESLTYETYFSRTFYSIDLFSIKISNSISSVQLPIKNGVPQGSVLSPIIFAIFLTPIQHIFNKYPDANYNLYADNIELHSNIESLDKLQNCFTDLHNWLTTNDLLKLY